MLVTQQKSALKYTETLQLYTKTRVYCLPKWRVTKNGWQRGIGVNF